MKKPKKCVNDPAIAGPALTELLRVLEEEVPPILNGNKFDMRTWHRREGCNTTACAWGWGYELSPALQAAGMSRFGCGGPLDPRDGAGLTLSGCDWLFYDLQGKGRGTLRAVCNRIRRVLDEECGGAVPA